MKKIALIGLVALTAGLLFIGTSTYAQGYMNNRVAGCCNGMWHDGNWMGMNRMMMGSGTMNRGSMMSWYNCPWDNPAMMMGPMSGAGMSQGPWQNMRYDNYGNLAEPLSKKQAKNIAQYYVDMTGNPRLKVGRVDEKSNAFEVTIVTKDNSEVERIIIDKQTGSVMPKTP